MPKLTFYPLGNADCLLMDLTGGEKLIFDYANTRCSDDANDKRIDLKKAICDDFAAANRDNVDVFAISHLDKDHIGGSTEIFWLQHAKCYQAEDRIHIDELWVPACVLVEEGLTGEPRIWREEARHRLREGKGIRIFSRPEVLEKWAKLEKVDLASRRHLFSDAGTLVPEWTLVDQGVEFFVHSPYASRLEDGTLMDRNTDGLFLQAAFEVSGVKTRVMMGADADYEVLTSIVEITEYHNRTDRLEWDIFKLPHHCSYLSLAPDKGKSETVPVAPVERLYETYGQHRGIIVSTSWDIPLEDTDQPPHRQAAAYYRRVLGYVGKKGDFKVTMEHPRVSAPKPLVIEIGVSKARITSATAAGANLLIGNAAPRAGSGRH